MKIFKTLSSPLGAISVAAEGDFLTNLVFGSCVPDAQEGTSSVLNNAISQLNEYFAGTRKSFDLPLKFDGTEFQMLVWQELQSIPYGKTTSYKELAGKTAGFSYC